MGASLSPGSPRSPRRRARRFGLLLGVLVVLDALTSPAYAYFLDDDRRFAFRVRAYSETDVAAEKSQPQTVPSRVPFQVISHRNFFNPEFDAKLTSYQHWLDDWSFRLALWGFYDGVYDYATGQYDRARRSLQGRISEGHTNTAAITRTDQLVDPRKVYEYQPDPVLGSYGEVPFRVNETYFNFKKGPVFLRVGRQTISWGESDTIALLDANNPFNVTLGIPGVFQDVDEARIPLWTLRSTVNLFDSWKWLSSGYLDTYLVPGSIDTTVSPTPIPTVSPYSPPQPDPQSLIAGLIPPDVAQGLVDTALGGIQIGVYDHLPSRSMSNSRFGVRLGAIVNREYTTSLWYYRTFANPSPRFLPLDLSRAPLVHPGGKGPTQLITELRHELVDVFGGAASFFSEKLDGIIRTEVEFFHNEAGFIPNQNVPFENTLKTPALRKFLNALGQDIPAGPNYGTIPKADMLRFEIGYDRFFFFRLLNPSNSFTWVTAYVGQLNLSEIAGDGNYRFGGQQKLSPTGTRVGANTEALTLATIGKLHTVATDFVDLYPFESLVQTHLETSYMHGRLNPSVSVALGLNGNYIVPMGLNYRFSDYLQFDLKYILTGGAFMFPSGYFRDRSQLGVRMTALFN